MRPSNPLSQTLCRFDGRPENCTCTSLPPLSLLSEQCRGWCMSPTKGIRNFRSQQSAVPDAVQIRRAAGELHMHVVAALILIVGTVQGLVHVAHKVDQEHPVG